MPLGVRRGLVRLGLVRELLSQQQRALRPILPGLVGLLAGCAAMQSAPPERLEELRTKARACSEALPAISSYGVDRFGNVQAVAQDPDATVIERNFSDCLSSRGRWATWEAGQPAPMLEPPGADDPDPELGRRVP